MIPQLDIDPASPFPPVEEALERPDGLLAWGGDLHPTRLVAAYRHGIFPWYSPGQPILWWSPDPRCVIDPEALYVSRRLQRRLRQDRYCFTADRAFREVIETCAMPREEQPGTWITSEMTEAYTRLHDLGVAHSIEVWDETRLIGGIYGLSIGRVFFGESMFSNAPDASKMALAALCRQMRRWDHRLLDCQITSPHLLSLGAVEIPRQRFMGLLAELMDENGQTGNWADCFESAVTRAN